MPLHIAVTGSSGFVGTQLVPYLRRKGHDICSLKRDSVDKLHGIDSIIHLAGAGRDATATECEEANQSTSNLLIRAQSAGVKHFIFISSIAAQTSGVSPHVLTEADAPNPTSQYGKAKLDAERLVLESSIPFTILRPVAISGPNAKGNLALLQNLARLPIPLPLAGLRAKRSIVSVENFNRAVQTVLTNSAAIGEMFIVADPVPQTVGEIVSHYRAEAGRSPNMFYLSPSLMRLLFKCAGRREMWERLDGQLLADSTKLMSIGWRPR